MTSCDGGVVVLGCGGSNAADIIREEVSLRSLEETRDNLREVGNDMRTKEGHDVLAKRAMSKFEPGLVLRQMCWYLGFDFQYRKKYVITSIRHPAEITSLRTLPRWRMIYVDAPVELRFERLLKRGRIGDDSTLEQFRENEEKELASANPAGQKILACKELADEVWMNEGSLEEFCERVDGFVRTC